MLSVQDAPLSSSPTGGLRELFVLAWPLMFSNLAYTAVGFTDTLIMGRLGVTEVGAVGFASICVLTVMLLFRGSLNSASTFVARALGRGDRVGVRRWASVFLGLSLVGLPLALAGPFLIDALFAALRPDAAVAAVARPYAQIRMLEAPLLLLGTVSISVMLGMGNTRTPMVLSWLVMILNAVLALLFVFVFHWGALGAAWASVIAVSVQNGLAFVLLRRLHGPDFGSLLHALPARDELRSISRVSLPTGLTELGEVSAFTVFQGVISRLGPTELAASQIAIQLSSLGFLPAYALAAATGSLLSRALGAERPDIATRIGWRGALLAALLMGILGLLFLAAPRALISLFNTDPEVLAVGTAVLAVMAAFQLLDGIGIVLGGALGGAGDTRFRLVVTLVGAWLFMVGGATVLTPLYGVTGAWGAALVYIVGAALAFGLRFRSGRWRGVRL
ncbi:MATE family efflux transporter [Deinococcus peraridilitoris]|uniref:Multidrug-efflux transporter n=1 Tax=Deinococcus peraridilitoris (strain DSM 19664 / LMG 22246 / CIP 109416 / KR-200) TaxID=937777 RepID=L0A060_DEIPD|nr:MATE family efflux transporter [Deinococcus peraridilitoris]AFZ67273.1 putative efflux protein, MATE family [Deinococcus peraridilitoris DSM 19664]